MPNQSEPGDNLPVYRTEVKTWLTYETTSPLGRALMDIAAENEQFDGPPFDEQAVEDDLKARRGAAVTQKMASKSATNQWSST